MAGFKLDSLKVDDTLQTEGVWTELFPGLQVRIARLGNPKCEKLLQKLRKPHLRTLRKGQISEELADSLLKQAMAKTVLLDWKGLVVTGENGEDVSIPYSPEQALKFFQDKSIPDFFDAVLEFSRNAQNFHEDDKEETEGN